MIKLETIDNILNAVGTDVAVSEWTTVSQAQVNQFAISTRDRQWIHCDPERAANGPFGTPIVHGFLVLSLLVHFFKTAMEMPETKMKINYGLNKLRFINPVPVESQLRARFHLQAVDKVDPATFSSDNAYKYTWQITIEMEDKVACVFESINIDVYK